MSQSEMIGVVVVGLGGILSLIVTFSTLVSKPINNLNVTIEKLNATLEHTNSNVSRIDRRVDKHGDRLDDHDKILARNNLT